VVLKDLDVHWRAAAVLAEIQVTRAHGHFRRKDGKLAVEAIARSIHLALRDAGCGPDDIDCLSASANGSVATDGYEACAAACALGGRAARRSVTAVKSMLGDTLGASGAMQLIDLVESMRQGMHPGIPNLDKVDAGFPLPMAGPESRELKARIGLVNAVGAHGSCCSLVVALRT
jgi:3-oxoacyl-(acyl-carrier-protein) synthase